MFIQLHLIEALRILFLTYLFISITFVSKAQTKSFTFSDQHFFDDYDLGVDSDFVISKHGQAGLCYFDANNELLWNKEYELVDYEWQASSITHRGIPQKVKLLADLDLISYQYLIKRKGSLSSSRNM